MATRTYEKGDLTVFWDSTRCIHTGICLRSLHSVFNLRNRPWVDLDGADAELLQRGHGVFARRAAAEVLAADEDVAGAHLLRESRSGVTERVHVELVLADHERRVASGDHLVGVEVIAEDPCARH